MLFGSTYATLWSSRTATLKIGLKVVFPLPEMECSGTGIGDVGNRGLRKRVHGNHYSVHVLDPEGVYANREEQSSGRIVNKGCVDFRGTMAGAERNVYDVVVDHGH